MALCHHPLSQINKSGGRWNLIVGEACWIPIHNGRSSNCLLMVSNVLTITNRSHLCMGAFPIGWDLYILSSSLWARITKNRRLSWTNSDTVEILHLRRFCEVITSFRKLRDQNLDPLNAMRLLPCPGNFLGYQGLNSRCNVWEGSTLTYEFSHSVLLATISHKERIWQLLYYK